MQITKNILRAYEYYIYIYIYKNNDGKIPFQGTLDFSKLKGKHEIYIKCAMIEKTPILNAYIF